MTVTTTESSNTWIADGSTNEFSFTFPILDKFNLLVKKQNPLESLTDMVLGIDYTVTGVGNIQERTNYKSGKIAFLQNIPAGSKIIIKRNIPKTQEIDYVENTGLPAQGHEEALDKITMILQELNNESKNAITLAPDIENITPEISNIKPDDFLKIAPDGSGIIGINPQFYTGIKSIYDDNSPTLSNTLDTNYHDIRFESNHGLVNSADNPILTVKYDDQNTSHLEIDTTKGHQQPIIRATSNNENTDLMLEAKGNGSISTLNNLNALQGISVTGSIQAVDNEKDDADLILNSKGSGNIIIDGVPIINEINTLKNTVATVEPTIDTVENSINTLSDNINIVENTIIDIKNKIDIIESTSTTIENNITTIENNINTLQNTSHDVSINTDNLENKYNNLKNKYNASKNITNNAQNRINSLESRNNIKINRDRKSLWALRARGHGINYILDGNNRLILDYIYIESYMWCLHRKEGNDETLGLKQSSKNDVINLLHLNFKATLVYDGSTVKGAYTYIDTFFDYPRDSNLSIDANRSSIVTTEYEQYQSCFGYSQYCKTVFPIAKTKKVNNQPYPVFWEGMVYLYLKNNSYNAPRYPNLESRIGPMPV